MVEVPEVVAAIDHQCRDLIPLSGASIVVRSVVSRSIVNGAMVVRFGRRTVFVPIANRSNVRGDTEDERIHQTMARLSEAEDGQDDEDHGAGGHHQSHC